MRANVIRRFETGLLLAGVGCLAAALWAVAEQTWFQWRYRTMDFSLAPAGEESPRGGSLGRIEIPRVGLSAVILDGVDARALRRGVGLVPGTSLPGGGGGGTALAAHRDTFFRNLRFVRPGDTVRLAVPGLTADYRIERTKVVKPWQTEVLQSAREQEGLTLLTCYPFTYVGPAPERFVVYARRAGREPGLR